MAKCPGIKRNGGKCTATVAPPQMYCWWHDPANKDARKRAAAKGGRGKATRKVAMIWDKVVELIDKVEDGKLEPSEANTMLRGYNVLIQQRRLELDEEERREILPRLEMLEEQQAATGGRH
jgi:hypothetical protein